MKPRAVLNMLIVSLMCSTSVYAECGHRELINSDSYGVRAPARFVHGVSNIVSSPVQFFTETRYSVKCGHGDLLAGLGSGVISSGKYLIYGVWDLATFWVPGKGGQDLAIKDCGWEEAARDCEKPNAIESKPLK